jgi:high-affinity iron transporter
MDFSSALPTFAIALREGVEAALVVGIVLACLQKADRSYLNSWVYAGIAMDILCAICDRYWRHLFFQLERSIG